MRTYTTDKATIKVDKDCMYTEESNKITVTPIADTNKSYVLWTITWPQDHPVPSSSIDLTFTIDGDVYVITGSPNKGGKGFYFSSDSAIENLGEAIMNSQFANVVNVQVVSYRDLVYVAQKDDGVKHEIEIESSGDELEVESDGETSWNNSLGDGNTMVRLSIYDKGDDTPANVLSPITVVSRNYSGGGSLEFDLGNIMDSLQEFHPIFTALPSSLRYSPSHRYRFKVSTYNDGNSEAILEPDEEGADIVVINGKLKTPSAKWLSDYLVTSARGRFLTTVPTRLWNAANSNEVDYLSIVSSSTQSGVYYNYRFYHSDSSLISETNHTLISIPNGYEIISLKVNPPSIPDGTDYFYFCLTDGSNVLWNVKYRVIYRYNHSTGILYVNTCGGLEVLQFCGNENESTMSRKGSFASYTKYGIPSQNTQRFLTTYSASSDDSYMLRTGLIPAEISETYSFELCNTRNAYLIQESGVPRPISITGLEVKYDENKSNSIIELNYVYAN